MIRVGFGYDVHRFCTATPGDEHDARICGVRLISRRPVIAHSDGDVVLHALVDALLGAVGAGDIGIHYPPTDLQWKAADSSDFVKDSVALVASLGWQVVNVDVLIYANHSVIALLESVRLMNNRLIDLLHLDSSSTNVTVKNGKYMNCDITKGLAIESEVAVMLSKMVSK